MASNRIQLYFFSFMHQNCNMNQSSVQWVYANGSSWVALDETTGQQIETLWSRHAAGWIQSSMFKDLIYVDTVEMILFTESFSFTIARTTN